MTGLMRLLALQPLRVHYFWGKMFAWLLSGPLHYRRDVATVNIARSFPEKRYKELKQITADFYGHFGRLLAETFWFAGAWDRKRLHDSHVCEVENPELLDSLFSGTPGVMLLNSHLGNWEISGGLLQYIYPADRVSFTEKDVTVVYKQLANKFWDRVIGINRCAAIERENWDSCYVESKHIMRYVVEHKGVPHIYVFPTDQCPYSYASSHTVDNFMHQPTKTMTGAAALAHKYGMSVCYLAIREKEGFGYSFRFREICRDASLMTPEEIMNKFYRMLEEDISEQPQNYMWTHKRWKK